MNRSPIPDLISTPFHATEPDWWFEQRERQIQKNERDDKQLDMFEREPAPEAPKAREREHEMEMEMER